MISVLFHESPLKESNYLCRLLQALSVARLLSLGPTQPSGSPQYIARLVVVMQLLSLWDGGRSCDECSGGPFTNS